LNGSALLWIDAAGQPAATYLESTRAILRLVDKSADLNPGTIDDTTAQVRTELSGIRRWSC